MLSLLPARSCVLVLALCGCEASPGPAIRPEPAKRALPGPPALPVAPSVAPAPAVPAWVAFRSERWDFAAEFPTPPATEVVPLATAAGQLEMHIFSSEHDGRAYMISALDGPTAGPGTPAKILDGARDGAVANIGGRLVAETQLLHSGLPARRIEIVAHPAEGEQRLIGLLILRERRLYQILVVAPSAAPGLPEAAERFFAGLKIVGAG